MSGRVEGIAIGVLDQIDVRRRCWKVGQIVIEERWRQISDLYHSCLHLSALKFLLPKMNFGSSVLDIISEPVTDCCRYVGSVDTIEQLLMVQIVECSCQIERDEHCSMSWPFSSEAGRNVGGDRRQCRACRVFRPKAMLRRVERDVCQYLGSRSYSSVLADGRSRLIVRQFLSMLSLPSFMIGMIIALCHISGICPVEIDRLKMLVR